MGEHHNTTKVFLTELTGSALYGVPHIPRTCTPQWFPCPRCWTSDRQPTSSGPTTWHYDGDRRRQRQTHSGDKRSGSSLTADHTPEWRRRNLLLLSCNPLTPEPMKYAAVSTAPGPVVEPPQASRSWTCFQENIGYEALTVPSGCANWSDRTLTKKDLALQPKLNDVLLLRSWQSSVP